MGSKMIMDSVRLLEETLVTLTEATRLFPVKGCSRASVERWVRCGSRGVILESILICGKRYTSKEAINRFIRNQLQIEPERAASESKAGILSKKEIKERSERLGLPIGKQP